MNRVICCTLLLLAGCASKARFERDRFSSSYHSGGDRLVVSQLGPTIRKFAGDEANQAKYAPLIRPEDEAVTSLVFSGIALAMNRDYYKSPYITGRAHCRGELEPEFEVPCGSVGVVFQDRETGNRQVIHADNGDFAFEAEEGRLYTVSPESTRYELSRPVPPLRTGDDIVLHLVRSAPRAD